MTRARWAAAAGLAILAVAGAVWALTPATRFVVGSTAAGVDEAILFTRLNEGASRHWVELVAADGTLRWSAEITPVEGAESLGYTGALAAGEQILALGTGKEPHAAVVIALSRDDGHRLWEATLPGTLPFGGAGRIGPMLLADSERVFVVHEVAGAEGTLAQRIDALSLSTGAAIWSLDGLDGAPFDHTLRVEVVEDRLSVSSLGGAVVEVDAATGAVGERIDGSAMRCGALLGRPHPAYSRTVWEAPCGARGPEVVVGIAMADMEEWPDSIAIARFEGATGNPMWFVNLGTKRFDGGAVVDGPLPRFLPVAVHGDAGELVIVDLDQHAVVQRLAVTGTIEVLVSSGRAWLWLPSPSVLVATDPATGLPTTAIAFAGARGDDVRLEDVRFGQLWVMGDGFARPGDLPWAVVDLATGELAGANGGMVAKDVTADVLGAWGL